MASKKKIIRKIKKQIPVRQLKNGLRVITVEKFEEDSIKMSGDSMQSFNHNEIACDYIEIIGEAKVRNSFNPHTGNKTIVFSKPVLMFSDVSEDLQEGIKEEISPDEKQRIAVYHGESINSITRTLNRLRKLAQDSIDEEISIYSSRNEPDYLEDLKKMRKDSEDWCIHMLLAYFENIYEIKKSHTFDDDDDCE